MKPFLKSVAEAYVTNNPDLTSVCFVFPNKRSGTFFLKYLKESIGDKPIVAPHITTISDFIISNCDCIMAGRIELLFMLYEEYCRLAEIDVEFDSFRSWGDIVLSDFSDVDMYGVNPAEIFQNLKDFRDIRSNYLTEEQKEVMAEYFGADINPIDEANSFWKHFNKGKNDTPAKDRFLMLWETLGPLYEKFNERLQKERLCYNGMSYRLAYENLKNKNADSFEYERIVFVGFNVLSTLEWKIFDLLQRRGVADFYWDCTGPALADNANTGGYFIVSNKKHFHSLYDISDSNANAFPSYMKAISSPSNSAQAKIAGEILGDISSRIGKEALENATVAVVLPDENLLLPMLHSLPADIDSVNLTMGYPLRLTTVASFVSLIRRLQSTKKFNGESIEYYHEEVRLLLAHPFVNKILGEKCIQDIRSCIDDKRLFMIPVAQLNSFSESAEIIFKPIDNDVTPIEAVDFLITLLDFVRPYLADIATNDDTSSIDCMQLDTYKDALCRLRTILEQFNIDMKYRTVFHLADRLLGGETVRFEGEPLKGVQIIGVLETRCLDFDYIIMPSMNERVFPRRLRSKSFIPDSLRRGYGMATIKYQESIFAYYFYRLISRAKEVTMIYDARTFGLKSGDVSRYLMQLKYLYPKSNLDWEVKRFAIAKSESEDIVIKKEGQVWDKLDEYCDFSYVNSNFSASSLYNYILCPMKFYFSSILGLSDKNQPDEFMDASMQGTIFHNVMQSIYTPGNESGHILPVSKLITPEFFDKYINNRDAVLNIVEDEIRKSYLHIDGDDYVPLDGDVEMMASVICEFVLRTLRHDKELSPFHYLGSEVDRRMKWTLPSGRQINTRCMIDRVDMLDTPKDKILRLVDYKTGTVHRHFETVDDIFDGKNRLNAVFQLLLYSNLYAQEFAYDSDIRPSVYEVLKFDAELSDKAKFDDSDREGNFKLAEEPIHSYLSINNEFIERLNGLIEEIFTKDIPFRQTCNIDSCKFCNFAKLCQR